MRVQIILFLVILATFTWANFSHAELTGTDAAKYFSRDYPEARQKFLEASQAIGIDVESFRNPEAGPDGEPLYTDVALIGPKEADIIIVLVSGTHGVEGFAGSGIQTGLLREGIASSLKPGMSILMIHAINPFGFAHMRRFNEDNVDLNRNFVDHSKPYPANPGYEELAEAISPKSISFWANVNSIFKLLQYRLKNGSTELKKAVSGGQYIDPQGIFYGGHRETWSNKTLNIIIKGYLSNAERVVLIDFHTGLGPYGNAEIILNEKEHSPAYKRAVEWWGEMAQTSASGKSVSVHIQSTLKLAIPKILPDIEVTAVTLEFGTFSTLKVFWALRTESWSYNYGDKDHPNRNKITNKLLRVFYPEDNDWKNQVYQHGKEVVEQVIGHL